ncbi:hypothetical protein IFM89_034832 [Coptis chinensis]|uniref:Disease resistance N-terminal domain-containing protein n=1 Tax=Coptis chinensis TaxID=261450 RepID=A0A835LKE6_9MAGN|nr:hypothetical protein IFM89_034832 [Coptis chinensis]
MSTYQDNSEDSSTNEYPGDYYPVGKIYEFLGDLSSEEYFWHQNLKPSIDMLNEKLESPRLRRLDKLWYSGFEDRELKKLERSLFTIRIVLDDIEREQKELKVWRIQHSHLKDLLCEVDDILDDIALRALQLKLLLQSPQKTTKHCVSQTQSTPVSSHAPTADIEKHLTEGKKYPTPLPTGNEMPMFFAFVPPQAISTPKLKNELVQTDDEIVSKPSDTISTPKEEGSGRKKNYTQNRFKPDDLEIYDKEPPPTSSGGASMSKTKEEGSGRKKNYTQSRVKLDDLVIYDKEPMLISGASMSKTD